MWQTGRERQGTRQLPGPALTLWLCPGPNAQSASARHRLLLSRKEAGEWAMAQPWCWPPHPNHQTLAAKTCPHHCLHPTCLSQLHALSLRHPQAATRVSRSALACSVDAQQQCAAGSRCGFAGPEDAKEMCGLHAASSIAPLRTPRVAVALSSGQHLSACKQSLAWLGRAHRQCRSLGGPRERSAQWS